MHLPELTSAVTAVFNELHPDVVLTHPYEGGHPDHDATAFAVHAACYQLKQEQDWSPVLLEMAFYHNNHGEICPSSFLPCEKSPVPRHILPPEQQETKRKMLTSFGSQQEILKYFSLEQELFRPVPRYDFTTAPHPGLLFYELHDWGMRGEYWRELANAAIFEMKREPIET